MKQKERRINYDYFYLMPAVLFVGTIFYYVNSVYGALEFL